MAAGRPKKEISKEQFEKLCALQCTLEEIAGFFDCCEDTIENWCKRTYKENFSDIYKKHSAKGKMSLRRNQFKLSEKSAVMAIFLGKQYLGQRDIFADKSQDETKQDDGFIDALNGTAEQDWTENETSEESSIQV